MMESLALPQSLHDRFDVLYQLGEGGMGSVWKVLDRELSEVVALKAARTDSPEFLLRLKHEFRIRAELTHENLVQLYELFVSGRTCLFTMQLLEGVPLFEWVRGEPPGWTHSTARPTGARPSSAYESEGGEDVDLVRLETALLEIGSALVALHDSGLVHGDIKPDNILVSQGRAVLVDFGLTNRQGPTERLEARGRVAGTPAYMAPELFSGQASGGAADVYALGLTVAVLLTGATPDRAPEELRKLRHAPGSPGGELSALALGMISPDPSARPNIREILSGRGISLEPSPGQVFVGRRDELEQLSQWLRGDDGFSLLHLTGASGTGKSRLLHEALRGIPSGTLVLASRCSPDEILPYQGLDAVNDSLAVRLAATLAESHDSADLIRDIREAGLAHVLEAEAEGPASPESRILASGNQDVRLDAADAWCRLLARTAAASPVLLVIDDAQWLDRDSQAFLHALVQHRPPAVKLLVVSRDPNAESLTWSAPVSARVIELSGLSASELEEWLALSKAPPALSGARLREELSGIPLLVEQLLRCGPDASLRPHSHGILSQRLQKLTTRERDLLEAASISGQALSAEALLRTAELHSRHRPLLSKLRSQWLLKSGGTDARTFEVQHDLLRVAVLETLSKRHKEQLHGKLARALETCQPTDVSSLFYHFRKSGAVEQARKYGLLAASAALEARALDRAQRAFEYVLENQPWPEQRVRATAGLGDTYASLGSPIDAAECFEQAARAQADLSTEGKDAERLVLLAKAGQLLLQHGRPTEGWRLLSDVLAAVGVEPPRSKEEAAKRLAKMTLPALVTSLEKPLRRVNPQADDERQISGALVATGLGFSMSNPTVSEVFRLAAQQILRRGGDRESYLRTLLWEGVFFCYLAPGWCARRAQKIRRFVQEELGPNPNVLDRLCLVVFDLHRSNAEDRFGDALELSLQVERLAQDVHGPWAVAYAGAARYYRPLYEITLDRLDEARASQKSAGARTGYDGLGRPPAGALVWLHLAAGRAEDALEELSAYRARAIGEAWPLDLSTIQTADLCYARAAALRWLGRGQQALDEVEAEWPNFADSGLLKLRTIGPYIQSMRGHALIAALMAGPHPDQARLLRLLGQTARASGRFGTPRALAYEQSLLAARSGLLGERGKMLQHLEKARIHFGDGHSPVFLEACHMHLSRLREGSAPRFQLQKWAERSGVLEPERFLGALLPLPT